MNKPAIIIQMEGGIIHNILTTLPEGEQPEIIVVDYDTDGADEEETTRVFGKEAFVFEPYVETISEEDANEVVNAVQV